MKTSSRYTDKEYESLSIEYEQVPPGLSGKPGFLTRLQEKRLLAELLPPDYVRIINMKANAMLLSPSEVIQYAIKEQLVGSA
jgi:hypothetical protein